MTKVHVGRLLERVTELSTLPEVTQRILSVTENPDASARDLNEVLRHDIALSSKLLRVVNSAFYGLPGRVASLDRAIVLLGFQAVRNLAVASTMGSMFRSKGAEMPGFDPRQLWRHCVATGVAARCLVAAVGLRSLREEAFLGGILHDIGVLVEFQYASQHFAQIVAKLKPDGPPLEEVEALVLEMNHQEIGQALAERWKFPRNIQLVTGYHHRAARLAPEHRVLPMVVSLAGHMAEQAGFRFLTVGEESYPVDLVALKAAINLAEADFQLVQQGLPGQVEQANSWLDL